MDDSTLIELISQQVIEELTGSGCVRCAERSCEVGSLACDFIREIGKTLVPVGVSARHAHLTQEHLEILYGPGSQLNEYAPLYQPNNFAARETVTVVGPRMRAIESVRVLGPLRDYSQVELSRTDAIRLGIDPPVRESSFLDGAAPILLVGPKGSVFLEEGAILANRHIHMNPTDAACFGVAARKPYRVRVDGERGVTFENVYVKISEGVLLQMHLDTDDANAAGLHGGELVELIVSS